MDFVNNIDFIFCTDRKMDDFFADFTRFIHLSMGCCVNFNHVHAAFFSDSQTGTALAAGFAIFRMFTVQSFCKNTGRGGFSDPSGTYKQISLRDSVADNRVFQGAGNMFLSDHVGKLLRTPFSCDNLICHKNTLIPLCFSRTDRKHSLPDHCMPLPHIR